MYRHVTVSAENAYNDSAFYPEVFLLKQPNLHFLSTLKKSKYEILRSTVVCLLVG